MVGGKGGNFQGERPEHGGYQQLLNRQTNKSMQRLHIKGPEARRRSGLLMRYAALRKATPRAQQKADWHLGTCPEKTVREGVGILGG